MCLTPIRIKNCTRRFVRGLSRPFLTVKCGKCKECIQARCDDWFVRAFFEFKRIKDNGFCIFPTLTFDEDHLPYWTDGDYKFPCFDNGMIKRFRDKLRVYMMRDGYDPKGIRYISCPEFGGKRGRPHYHVLLFVPFHVPLYVMKAYLQKAWVNGMVMYSPKYGEIVTSDHGTKYVMKYVSKPSGWFSKYGIDKYQAELKQAIRNEKDEAAKEEKREHYREFKRHCPRHTQSTFFGVAGVDYFKDGDGCWDMQRLVDGRIDLSACAMTPDSKQPSAMFNIPEYYARKIFYREDEWKLYQRTPLAHEVFALRWQLNLESKIERLTPYFSDAEKCQDHVGYLHIDGRDVFRRISVLMGSRCVEDLVLYDMVYRGLQMDDAWKDMSMQDLHDNALDFMIAQRSVDVPPAPEPPKYTRYAYSPNSCEFGSHPCFSRFDDVLKIVDECEEKIGESSQAAYKLDVESKLALHDIVSPYNFHRL